MKGCRTAVAALCAGALLSALGAAKDEMRDGRQVGVSLFDGKVIVAGTTLGTGGKPAYVLRDLPSGEGVRTETKSTANAVLVKYVFPKATELRVQVDYGFGFPEGTQVRVTRPTDETVDAVVYAGDGEWYFHSEMSNPYSRPGLFADGTPFLFSEDVTGAAPVGYLHECFYGLDGDDIQVKTAMSRVSLADATRKLKEEMDGFLPRKRPIIWQEAKDAPEPRPMKGDANAPSLDFIQRTMKKIAESTAENPATVKVLFYGQSIVWQSWNRLMMQDLKERYPTVNFVWRNRAIGGYGTDMLRDCWTWDVAPFYPDIVFFHDYGDMRQYAEMVRRTREETTAEIVLWTSHLRGNGWGSDPVALTKTRDVRSRAIIDIAAKYHCHVIDLNRKWCRLFLENKWNSNKLLVDGIHLNAPGILQYRNFIEEDLIRIPGADGDEEATGSERFFALADGKAKCFRTQKDGTLEFTFTGNRVTAVSDGTADPALKAEILLDGRPLASCPELWALTRPSAMLAWFPGLHMVGFKSVPVEEQWRLEILPPRPGDPTNRVLHAMGLPERISSFRPVRFRVTGSVTGFDGEGISTNDFVSNSGRVAFPVRAWADWPQWDRGDNVGRETRWRAFPLHTDVLTAKPAGEETLILQGCSNATHKLTIRLPKGAKSGLRGFRVWSPAPPERKGIGWSEL